MSFEFRALPNVEAIEYFRSKGYAPAVSRFSWRDVWADEHDRMFTVAKAMREDVLSEIRGAVDAAIADGISLDEFKARLEPKLHEYGWWGKGLVPDPKTGRIETAQLGSARRLEIIYDTNLRTANAAGRWKRAQRNKALMPFFSYIQIDRPSKREAHAPFNGVTLPVDHPFWHTHWPPNGWQCGCIVRQISKRTLQREGLSVTDESRVAEIGRTRAYEDKRNGVTRQVPLGIDPSFERNAGRNRFDPGGDAAPGPSAPQPDPRRSPRDPFSDKKREGAALKAAFSKAEPALLDAIAAMKPLDGLSHRRKGAVFMRKGKNGVITSRVIDMNKLSKGSPEYAAVLRHEYGHALDFEAGGGMKPISMRHLDDLQMDGDELVAASRDPEPYKRIAGEIDARVTGAASVEAGLSAEAARYGFTLEDALAAVGGTQNKAGRVIGLIAALDSRNALVLLKEVLDGPIEANNFAMLQDLIGAATNNRIKHQWGHTDSYYRERGATGTQLGAGNAAEAFANWVSMRASGDPVFPAIMRVLVPRADAAYGRLVERMGSP